MRGTEHQLKSDQQRRRFIPAHAGNRPRHGCPVRSAPVHPRACGEQRRLNWSLWPYGGSSPRMRGTGPAPCPSPAPVRFIPAHAGNSGPSLHRVHLPAVHPRACGEQHLRSKPRFFWGGSSPRMRGTGIVPFDRDLFVRFIPAHAGNRQREALSQTNGSVHPRACGEQERPHPMSVRHTGSSPRMRGTGLRRIRHRAPRRFIPAHAGNRGAADWTGFRRAVHPRACGEQLCSANP